MEKKVIHAALLGFGTVGTGVYKVLKNQEEEMEAKLGSVVRIKKIMVRNLEKAAVKVEDPSVLTNNWEEIVNDPDIDIIIELMGGMEPARTYILAALEAGKHVVSANKDLIAVYGKELLDMETLALTAFYSLERSEHITAEVTNQCRDNSFSSGCCFVEVEVDMPLGQVTVKDIVNVHDSGMLINPELAEAQVHGGMSMGLGYGLSEEFLYNDAGRPLNDNLLDYKIPTAMDTPDLHVKFIQLEDPTGPYGNKSLGEPPAIPVAPALRNAVLHATGVAMDTIPMTPQRLIEAFQAKGLI